tara:strand:+ start:1318 stop:2460 length:1143 start_codon:yes stop_codon:yes gene_type:complete
MDFSDISSYSDNQVPSKIKELESNLEFFNYLSNLFFPKVNKFIPRGAQFFIKRKFIKMFSHCKTIEEFQTSLAPLVQKMILNTTDGFTFSGIENLTDKPTLYIGNHRDISLDAAFLNYLLYIKNLSTVRIAIGDNLLDGDFAETLMRLNKSFIVHREIKGVKETLRKLSKLSAYINYSLQKENESIWIAQKEGRANDGNDFTDEGVLKMLYLDQRKTSSLDNWIKAVNLTPVVISYEYDPLDTVKAKGWDYQKSWSTEKINKDNLVQMASGIFEYKGRVHLHICEPISQKVDNTKDLSDLIQKEIITNYHIWPSTYTAASLLSEKQKSSFVSNPVSQNSEEVRKFKERFMSLEGKDLDEFLMIYARPLYNKEKASLSTGP